MKDGKTLVVCVAHPGDFVWRAGGALALLKSQGWNTHIICASLGIKGEAGALWREVEANEVAIGAQRKIEAETAAMCLGAKIEFLNLSDYPLSPSHDDSVSLNTTFRALRPDVVLTHTHTDPGNTDHSKMSHLVMQARMFALAPGYGPDMSFPFSVYFFEPHQPELCDFKADHMLDIDDVWDKKYAAFQEIQSQKNVWDYYERVALQRGAQASRRSSRTIRYAEAYQKLFPTIGRTFQ